MGKKFKWRKQDYFWLIAFILILWYITASVRLSNNSDVVNIISLIASGISIALAIVALYWGQVNNSEAGRIYDKINERLEIVMNTTSEMNKTIKEIRSFDRESLKFKSKKYEEKDLFNTPQRNYTEFQNEIDISKKSGIEHYIEDASYDELYMKFSRCLTQDEFDQFVELFNESDIPLDTADMDENYAGIAIHLNEKISAYEVNRAKEKMDKLLKQIKSDLNVEN